MSYQSFEASRCRIASVHFHRLSTSRLYRGVPYTIESVEPGNEPRELTIRTLIQREDGPYTTGENGTKREKRQYTVPAIDIAHCLVGEWTGATQTVLGAREDCRPGVWVVRDRVPITEQRQDIVDGNTITTEERMALDADGNLAFRAATQKEFEAMWDEDLERNRAADRAFAEYCVAEGERIAAIWENPNGMPVPREMPKLYIAAAKAYGIQVNWVNRIAVNDLRTCPSCGSPGNAANFMCRVCGQPTDVEKWAQFEARKKMQVEKQARMLTPKNVPTSTELPRGATVS